MGIFDRFVAEAECPHCGEEVEFGFQTKDLDQRMATYEVGDEVTVSGLTVDGTIEAVYTFHKCQEPDKDKIEERLEEMQSAFEEEDWSKLRTEADGIEHAIPDSGRVYADVVIEDGIYKEVENIRKERD